MEQPAKKPTWWETATPEQRAERIAKMNAGRAAAKAKRAAAEPVKPETKPEKLYIVLEGGSTKDELRDNRVHKICKTLEEAVEAMNAYARSFKDAYEVEREAPQVTLEKMQERIAKAWKGQLIFGLNYTQDDDEEEEEDEEKEENWDAGMWGNLLLTLQIMNN